ncbi:hypothetical protein ILYODFUR_039073 [Ilyodon furcidens]|uniref:Uncharacterized protein n=1 Tax=Ilyodon furcidens TaxID=33524 RepID=A0ABV0VM80_9TELE
MFTFSRHKQITGSRKAQSPGIRQRLVGKSQSAHPVSLAYLSSQMLESSILVAQLNMHSSTDIAALMSPRIIKPAENKVSLPFPACLKGRRNGGAYLERQKLAGELLLHTTITGRA